MPLGVAVVGVGADQWSGTAHLPAIAATQGVELVRLVTSNAKSARAAGDRWGVSSGHELGAALDDPAVDVVTVTVRVARHRAIVEAAIGAGKHVYCEWPLAMSTLEARELTSFSGAHPGRVHLVGLQGRLSPDLVAAGDAIRGGAIGRPLAASAHVFMDQGLQPRPRHRAHLRKSASAANVLTIQGGHMLDMLASVLGPESSVDAARIWTAAPEFTVAETGERLPRDAPDNVSALIRVGGVPATVQFSQTAARPSTRIEILGDAGSVRIASTGQPQMSQLSVTLSDLGGHTRPIVGTPSKDISIDRSHPGFNVARAYQLIARAVEAPGATDDFPTFHRALELHELLDAMTKKAAS